MIHEICVRLQAGEITLEEAIELVRGVPETTRGQVAPVEDTQEMWERAEDGEHQPGTWDDLYVEWLFGTITRPQFVALEAALLVRRT